MAGSGLALGACGSGSKSKPAASTSHPTPSGTTQAAAVTGQPIKGGTLSFPIGGDPPSLDLYQESTYLTNHAATPIYNQLIQFDPKISSESQKTIIGDLAKSWEQSPDGLAYTFKLNTGVTYHDGTPFTSADVKASLERIANPSYNVVSPRSESLKVIQSIEVPDANTAVLHLARPAPSLLPILAQGWMAIYSQKDIASGFDFKLKANGTGPFKLKNYLRGSQITFERFDQYFVKGQPYLDGITCYIMPDPSTQISSFQTGQLLLNITFAPTDAKTLISSMGNKIAHEQAPALGFNSINFGNHAPWTDVRARRAVSLAMDRKGAVALLDDSEAQPGAYMPPTGPWTLSDAELQAIPGYEPYSEKTVADAKALLKAAGVPDNFETPILTRQGASFQKLSVFIRDNLQKVGLNATLQVLESAAAYDALNKRDFRLAPWAHGIALDDPDAIFSEFYLSNSPRNYSQIGSKEVDDLFAEQSQTLDQQQREQLVKQMQQKALPLFSKVIIEWTLRNGLFWNKVHGYTLHSSLYNNNRHAGTWLAKT